MAGGASQKGFRWGCYSADSWSQIYFKLKIFVVGEVKYESERGRHVVHAHVHVHVLEPLEPFQSLLSRSKRQVRFMMLIG